MGSVNKVVLPADVVASIVSQYETERRSIPQVAAFHGLPRTRIRTTLMDNGVTMRGRQEAIAMAKREGRGVAHSGRYKRTQETRDKLSRSLRARADKKARGYRITSSGYVELTRGPDKGRLLHDVIGEVMIGRRLAKGEMVHHKDENRSHNEFKNLEVMTRSAHARHHALERIARGEKMESHFRRSP